MAADFDVAGKNIEKQCCIQKEYDEKGANNNENL